MRLVHAVLVPLVLASSPAGAIAQSHGGHADSREDTAFRAMQMRGKVVMGVDQYSSIHRFDTLPDGGTIELQRDRDDSAGAMAIRTHMRAIARAFATGDFSAPATVHLETVPGVPVMRARRKAIRYETRDLARGAALRIRTSDPIAVDAVRRFLAYQRREHRAEPSAHAHCEVWSSGGRVAPAPGRH
jgi:hypothetical protein